MTACSAFTAVNAAGATPISGAPKVSVGVMVADAVNPAPSAATNGQISVAASDSWFATSGNGSSANAVSISSQTPASATNTTPANSVVNNAAGNTTTGQSADDVAFGDQSSSDLATTGTLAARWA